METFYAEIGLVNEELGGMNVFRIYPKNMTEEDWWNVRCMMNIYAWTEPLVSLLYRIRELLGEKGDIFLDEEIQWIGIEEAEEMYMDYKTNGTIHMHQVIV